MELNNAIDKLNLFKKIAKKIIPNDFGKCELVNLNDDSFTIKVIFNDNKNGHNSIIGFAQDV